MGLVPLFLATRLVLVILCNDRSDGQSEVEIDRKLCL